MQKVCYPRQYFYILAADFCNNIPLLLNAANKSRGCFDCIMWHPQNLGGSCSRSLFQEGVVQITNSYKCRGNCSVRMTSKTGSFADGNV